MKEVSIIIEGVKYDAVEVESASCHDCALNDLCHNRVDYENQTLCDKFDLDSDVIFVEVDYERTKI